TSPRKIKKKMEKDLRATLFPETVLDEAWVQQRLEEDKNYFDTTTLGLTSHKGHQERFVFWRKEIGKIFKCIEKPDFTPEMATYLLTEAVLIKYESLSAIFINAGFHVETAKLVVTIPLEKYKKLDHLISIMLMFTLEEREQNPQLWHDLCFQRLVPISKDPNDYEDLLYVINEYTSKENWDEQIKLWNLLEPEIIQHFSDSHICAHACFSGNRKLIELVFSKYDPNHFFYEDPNSPDHSTVLWALTRSHLYHYQWNRLLDEQDLDFAEFVFSLPSFDPTKIVELKSYASGDLPPDSI